MARDKYVTITERKAPTDQSIGLLNEFTDKAQNNIIHTVRVDTNCLQAVGLYYTSNVVQDEVIFHGKFILNSKETVVKEVISASEWKNTLRTAYNEFGSETVYMAVYKKLSEMIALELMKSSPDFLESLKGGDRISNPNKSYF